MLAYPLRQAGFLHCRVRQSCGTAPPPLHLFKEPKVTSTLVLNARNFTEFRGSIGYTFWELFRYLLGKSLPVLVLPVLRPDMSAPVVVENESRTIMCNPSALSEGC